MIYKGNEITRGYYYESNKNLNNGLLWYSLGAMIQKMKEMLRLLQKRRDSKINELLGIKKNQN
jgi:hypothetical protein